MLFHCAVFVTKLSFARKSWNLSKLIVTVLMFLDISKELVFIISDFELEARVESEEVLSQARDTIRSILKRLDTGDR